MFLQILPWLLRREARWANITRSYFLLTAAASRQQLIANKLLFAGSCWLRQLLIVSYNQKYFQLLKNLWYKMMIKQVILCDRDFVKNEDDILNRSQNSPVITLSSQAAGSCAKLFACSWICCLSRDHRTGGLHSTPVKRSCKAMHLYYSPALW
jgi:hypothetical protein